MSREACRTLLSQSFKGKPIREWRSLEPLLQNYVELLLKRTDSTNLISRSQRTDEAIWLHILDSLHGLQLVDPATDRTILDAGSGNGLPGIVLASAIPSSRLVLLDRSRTKTDFLDYAVATLGLKDVTVLCSELSRTVIENVAPGLVTLRALENVEKKNPFMKSHDGKCDWLIFSTLQKETFWMERAAEPQLVLKQQLYPI